MSRFFAMFMLCLMGVAGTMAQVNGDSLRISLVTCSPGTEVYSLYGHTALRVVDPLNGIDAVFNYGVFDYRRPNFVWRFMMGKCDYEVAAIPFRLFMEEYEVRGSSVMEQTLLLTSEEKTRLYRNLVVNVQPQNKIYRYNFLTRNCTTKARDMIEGAVDGHVVYEEAAEHHSYREFLHRYSEDYPWTETGIDLLLGAKCDTVISDRAAQFLPEQLMQYLGNAQVYDDDNNRRPLVGATIMLLLPKEQVTPETPVTPLIAGMMAFVAMVLLMLVEHRWGRMMWWIDVLLMSGQGLAGILVTMMFLFSEHPTVDSNWQVLILNPLPLLFMPWVVRCARRRKVCVYHYVNALWQTLFLAFAAWIPQCFPVLTICLALTLLTRPVSYVRHYSREDKPKNEKP